MVKLNVQKSLVLIIDIQEKLINAIFDKDTCEKNAQNIAKAATIFNIPVIVTEQYPKGLGSTIDSVKNVLNESTKYFEKTCFSALDVQEIADAIKNSGKTQIIIFGIETHICVSQTVTALRDLGYEVHIVKDASGSRTRTEHEAGLERIKDNGGYVLTTEIALFEWLKTARNPKFKEIQELIK